VVTFVRHDLPARPAPAWRYVVILLGCRVLLLRRVLRVAAAGGPQGGLGLAEAPFQRRGVHHIRAVHHRRDTHSRLDVVLPFRVRSSRRASSAVGVGTPASSARRMTNSRELSCGIPPHDGLHRRVGPQLHGVHPQDAAFEQALGSPRSRGSARTPPGGPPKADAVGCGSASSDRGRAGWASTPRTGAGTGNPRSATSGLAPVRSLQRSPSGASGSRSPGAMDFRPGTCAAS
jgi:hypothetical protein